MRSRERTLAPRDHPFGVQKTIRTSVAQLFFFSRVMESITVTGPVSGPEKSPSVLWGRTRWGRERVRGLGPTRTGPPGPFPEPFPPASSHSLVRLSLVCRRFLEPELSRASEGRFRFDSPPDSDGYSNRSYRVSVFSAGRARFGSGTPGLPSRPVRSDIRRRSQVRTDRRRRRPRSRPGSPGCRRLRGRP